MWLLRCFGCNLISSIKWKWDVKSKLKKNKSFVSDFNRKIPKEWFKYHLKWPSKRWQQVIWSDESSFVSWLNRIAKVWVMTRGQCRPTALTGTVKHDKNIMLWGCFSYYGVGSSVKINGLMEQKQCKSILQRHLGCSAETLYGNNKWIFQHYNEPRHTSKSVKKYLKTRVILFSNDHLNHRTWRRSLIY
jgi:hypothetical protein